MSTISSYAGDGVTVEFDVTFDYGDQDTIFVRVDGSDVLFTFVNPSRVRLASAPVSGSLVEVYRNTPIATPTVVFQDGQIIRAKDLNDAVDQPRSKIEELGSEIETLGARAFRAPVGEVGGVMPTVNARKGKFLSFDVDGKPSTSSGTGNDPNLRTDIAVDANTRIGVSLYGFPAIVTKLGDLLPTLTSSVLGGVSSNGSTDDTLALQALIDWASASAAADGRHREIHMEPGQPTLVTNQIIVKPGVTLNFNSGSLQPYLAGGNGAGLRFMSRSGAKNGSIMVHSSGAPGTSAAAHAAALIGVSYGDGGTPSARSVLDRVSQVELSRMVLQSDKNILEGGRYYGAVGLAIIGEVDHVRAAGITIPSSAVMCGGASIDWGVVGEVARTGTLASLFGNVGIVSFPSMMELNRQAYVAGTAFTTHPNGIVLQDWKIGNMTKPYQGSADTGSFGVRMSGAHRVVFDGIDIENVTEYAVAHTAGDVGYEYARTSDYATALRGNVIRGVTLRGATTGANLLLLDSQPDNVVDGTTTPQYLADGTSSGVNYTAQRPLLLPTDLQVISPQGRSTAGALAGHGILAYDLKGGTITNPVLEGFLHNCRINACEDTVVEGLSATKAWNKNLLIEGGSKRVTIRGTRLLTYANQAGDTGTTIGAYIGASDWTTIDGGVFGANASDETTTVMLASAGAGDGVTNVIVRGKPLIQSHKTGGLGVSFGAGGTFGTLALIDGGFQWGANVTSKYGGQDCIPVQLNTRADGNTSVVYETYSTNTLVGLSLIQGTEIRFYDAASAGYRGRYAVANGTITSGNLNTLTKLYGAIT